MFRIVTAYAKNSKLSKINPYEKVMLCLIPVVIIGFSKSIILPLINIGIFILLHVLSKNPLKVVARFIVGLAGFGLLSAVTFVFDYGIFYFLLVILKCISGGLGVTYFTFTTPLDDCLYLLSKHKNLRDLCDIVKSMERFLIIIEDEFFILNSAMKARGGFDGLSLKIRNTGKVAGLLFVNTFRKWNDIKDALNSRCYAGYTNYMEKNFSNSNKRKLAIYFYDIVLIVLCFIKEW